MQFTKPLPSARLSARRSAQPTPGAVGSSRLPAPQPQAPPASSRSSRPQTTLVSRRSRPRVPLLVADHRTSAAADTLLASAVGKLRRAAEGRRDRGDGGGTGDARGARLALAMQKIMTDVRRHHDRHDTGEVDLPVLLHSLRQALGLPDGCLSAPEQAALAAAFATRSVREQARAHARSAVPSARRGEWQRQQASGLFHTRASSWLRGGGDGGAATLGTGTGTGTGTTRGNLSTLQLVVQHGAHTDPRVQYEALLARVFGTGKLPRDARHAGGPHHANR